MCMADGRSTLVGMSTHVDLSLVDQRLAGMERPASGGLTSGLSRALSERLHIDVVLIRVGFAVLAMFSGIGLALYLWGTVLTPRVGGVAPIRRLLPRFVQWTRNTQLIVIGASTLLVALLWSTGNALPTAALLGLALVAWLTMARRSPSAPSAQRVASWPPPQTGSQPTETVEQWRQRMEQAAARQQLPEVNLYDDPQPKPAPVARRSWLGALLVVTAGTGGAAAAIVFGTVSPPVVFASGAVASGVVLVAWSLLRRSRRIPGIALALVLIMSVCTAALGTAAVTPLSYSTAAETDANQREFDYVNVSGAELDLTGHESGLVTVNVVASDVTVALPGDATVELTHFGSTVDIPPATRGAKGSLRVEINALGSTVTGVRS